MIQLEWFTRDEAARVIRSGGDGHLVSVLRHAHRSAPTAMGDDPIAILAMEGSVVAGRMFLTYGCIADNGVPLRLAAAQSHATDPAFRGQGIGSALIRETRELQIPCAYSGISKQAVPLYRKLGFRFIDQAPIFQLPLSASSLVREWRSRYYEDAIGLGAPLRALKETATLRRSSLSSQSGGWRTLSPREGVLAIERIDQIPYRRFQVPRRLDRFRAALEGQGGEQKAFVIEHVDLGPEQCWLVTVQVKPAAARLPGTRRQLAFAEGHVVEIYPPVLDVDLALSVIRYLATQARTWGGVGALAVHAMTDALREACRALGARSRWRRNTVIEPLGLGVEQAEAMERAENWWCRAATEEHFEEAAGWPGHSPAR